MPSPHSLTYNVWRLKWQLNIRGVEEETEKGVAIKVGWKWRHFFFFLGLSGPAKGHKCIATSNSPDKRPIDVACTFGIRGTRSRNKLFEGTQTRGTGILGIDEVPDVGVYSAVLDASKATSSCQGYHCHLELDPIAVSNAAISFVGWNRHERGRELWYSWGHAH